MPTTLQEKLDKWNRYIAEQKRIIRKGKVVPINLFQKRGVNQ